MSETTTTPLLPASGVWAIEQSAVSRVDRALRGLDLSNLESRAEAAASLRGEDLLTIGSTAVINVIGPLEKRASLFGSWFGFSSTESIRRSVEKAATDSSIKTILLRIDSPGGSVDGLAEAGDAIYKARSSKRVVGQIDGLCASAAFYLASQASEIVAGRMDMVGSIGVKLVLWDTSEAAAKEGIKVVTIDTGEHKSAGEPGTVITDSQRRHFQDIVNAYFADFQAALRRGRGMNAATVKAVADGRMFMAEDAKQLGLIDRIQTLDSTLSSLRGTSTLRASVTPKPTLWSTDSVEIRQRRFKLIHKQH